MKSGSLLGILFGLPFFAVGVFTGWLVYWHIATYFEVGGWDRVPSVITAINTSAHEETSKDGNSSINYYLGAEYSYVYNGVTFQGRRISRSDKIGNQEHQSKVHDMLQPYVDSGEKYEAYVNPNDPSDAVLLRELNWTFVIFLSIFCLAFGGVGLGIIVGTVWGGKVLKSEAKLAEIYPNEPWKWNKQWENGVVKAHMKAAAGFLWFFALLWNVISFPISFIAISNELPKGNNVVLFVLLFPLVGIGLLIAAVRATIRAKKFGKIEFRMTTFPGVIGGKLAGNLMVSSVVEAQSDFVFCLRCSQTVRRGKDDTTENTLWQHIKNVPAMSSGNIALSGIPVEFTIPSTCQQTDDSQRIRWRLSANAETPGVDFATDFEVPVFQTIESRSDISEEAVSEDTGPVVIPVEPSKEVIYQTLPSGDLEIYIPSYGRRNPGAAVGMLVFIAIFGGAAVGTWYAGATIIVTLILGGIGLLIAWGLVVMVFRREVIQVNYERLKLGIKYFIRAKNLDWHKSEIKRVAVKMGSATQQGSKVVANYSVLLHLKGAAADKPQTIASDVGDRETAYWIADRVRVMLNLPAEKEGGEKEADDDGEEEDK